MKKLKDKCRVRARARKVRAMNQEPKWWIAINGSSCTANLTFPAVAVTCSPRPQALIGFPTRDEAAAAQQFLLNAPIEELRPRQLEWLKRAATVGDIRVIKVRNPEPETRGGTSWCCTNDPDFAGELMGDTPFDSPLSKLGNVFQEVQS